MNAILAAWIVLAQAAPGPANVQQPPAYGMQTPAFRGNIDQLARQNTNFRQVLWTGPHSQLVVMAIQPGQEIGEETHANVDQFFYFVDGTGQVSTAERATPVRPNDVVSVPAGMRHNVRNTGDRPLKLFTIYSPPQHPPGTIHRSKADAARAEPGYGR